MKVKKTLHCDETLNYDEARVLTLCEDNHSAFSTKHFYKANSHHSQNQEKDAKSALKAAPTNRGKTAADYPLSLKTTTSKRQQHAPLKHKCQSLFQQWVKAGIRGFLNCC
jgi:hypothetical protein